MKFTYQEDKIRNRGKFVWKGKKNRENWVFWTPEQTFLAKKMIKWFLSKNHFQQKSEIILSIYHPSKLKNHFIIISFYHALESWNDKNHFIMIQWFYDKYQIKW